MIFFLDKLSSMNIIANNIMKTKVSINEDLDGNRAKNSDNCIYPIPTLLDLEKSYGRL